MSVERTRVYLPGSRVAHLIDGLTSLNAFPYAFALCRVAPTWGLSEWFGTGSQKEYDEAERRRLCSRCAKADASANSAPSERGE